MPLPDYKEPLQLLFRMNYLEQLRKYTKVVADTSDFQSIKKFKPDDATTNPSLIYRAAQLDQYKFLIEDAVAFGKSKGQTKEKKLEHALDKLAVNFGCEILKIVSRRVSTEVNANLSFDKMRSVEKAGRLVDLYHEAGIPRDKVLIKLASTWEGIQAAKVLGKEGIHCNLTLLFSMPQAIACAEAGVQLISPFVGRIYDWYRRERGEDHLTVEEDPGVTSLVEIYHYYKKFGYKTEIMGASFRNIGQILALAGCDLLTISPALLSELESMEGTFEQRLSVEQAKKAKIEKTEMDETSFRWMLNENAMATEKLAEGIRRFYADLLRLGRMVMEYM